MQLEQLTAIGSIRSAHGLNGEFKVVFESFYANDIPALTALIIQKGDDFLPFFVESINESLNLLKFESISNKEEASKLNGKTIYALTDQLSEVLENEFEQFTDLVVIDQKNTEIGQIEDIIEMPQQILLQIRNVNGKEILLPYHEDLVIAMDEAQIQLHIPKGLLDIYQ